MATLISYTVLAAYLAIVLYVLGLMVYLAFQQPKNATLSRLTPPQPKKEKLARAA